MSPPGRCWMTALSVGLIAAVGPAYATPRNDVLFSFNGADGRGPSDLTADAAGVLYGTTQGGGGSKQCHYGCGTVFRLIPPTASGVPWTHEVLYSFSGQADGAQPMDRSVVDADGNLYGTTLTAGSLPYANGNHAVNCCGVVWELSPPAAPGGTWTYQTLHTFTGKPADGDAPFGHLVRNSGGTLFGTTYHGGNGPGKANGVAYALAPPPSLGGAWTETILHNFVAAEGLPNSSLVLTGQELLLVGTTLTIYNTNCGLCNLLYAIGLDEGAPTFGRRALVDTFISGSSGPVIHGNHNVFYSTVRTGGNGDVGGVMELSPPATPGGAWIQKVLHTFTEEFGGVDWPNNSLLATATGTLFGTVPETRKNGGSAVDGSSGGSGFVFRLDPPGAGSTGWAYTELHEFSGSAGTDGTRPDGGFPTTGLTFGRAHQMYGTTGAGGRYGDGTVYMQTLQ